MNKIRFGKNVTVEHDNMMKHTLLNLKIERENYD